MPKTNKKQIPSIPVRRSQRISEQKLPAKNIQKLRRVAHLANHKIQTDQHIPTDTAICVPFPVGDSETTKNEKAEIPQMTNVECKQPQPLGCTYAPSFLGNEKVVVPGFDEDENDVDNNVMFGRVKNI